MPLMESGNGLVECPNCNGAGYNQFWEDDPSPSSRIKCDVCHGKGRITQHEYEQWEKDVVDVYEAERQYIRSQYAD